MIQDARLNRRMVLMGALLLSGCASSPSRGETTGPAGFADIPYADWSDYEPPYRLYPGDEVDVTIPSAPELNKLVTVQPDGRISLPLISPVMVADRTILEARDSLTQAYADQLLRPEVGGEVGNPGVIEMVGDSDALRAVVQAGGVKPSGDLKRVILLRRGPDGRGMMRTVNLSSGLRRGDVDLAPLRRFDIVYVPRTGVAAAGIFVQQYFRDLIPATFGFSYALGERTLR
jgi:protein involved in polysaccharide export with SLBB domain